MIGFKPNPFCETNYTCSFVDAMIGAKSIEGRGQGLQPMAGANMLQNLGMSAPI